APVATGLRGLSYRADESGQHGAPAGPFALDDLPRVFSGGQEGGAGAPFTHQEPVPTRQPVPGDVLTLRAADSTAAAHRAPLERMGVRHEPAGRADARAQADGAAQGRHAATLC